MEGVVNDGSQKRKYIKGMAQYSGTRGDEASSLENAGKNQVK